MDPIICIHPKKKEVLGFFFFWVNYIKVWEEISLVLSSENFLRVYRLRNNTNPIETKELVLIYKIFEKFEILFNVLLYIPEFSLTQKRSCYTYIPD